ncbi:MAG: alpha/beta fold hydrolase [bacterium]|nr:alpha/beta fold hydrolase [bacterium]
MRPLGEALAAAGFPVVAPALAGHGTEVADLARTGWPDWLASAEAALAALRAEVPRVAVAGLSMGGLLALVLAARRPHDVAALVLAAPALRLADRRIGLLPWAARIPPLRRRLGLIPKRGGRDIADPDARAASRAYDAAPLDAVLALLALRREARRALPRVTQPVLLLQGRLDRTVPASVEALVRRRLGSRRLETATLEHSGHVLTEDVDRARVGALVTDFLGRVEAATQER